MSQIRTNVWRRAVAVLERNKGIVVLTVVVALTSSGTAAAVSYVVLGGINTASATTVLRSDLNGTVLQVSNFNGAGGASARGINITVPAGRPPITVSTTAGKATNLNADLLDGQNASAFLATNAKAADSELLDGMDSSAFLGVNQTAANSENVDGIDSAELQRATNVSCGSGYQVNAILPNGNANCAIDLIDGGDAQTLDGVDSSSFAQNRTYTLQKVTDGSANVAGTCPSGDLCFAGGLYCDSGDIMLTGGFEGLDNGTRLVSSAPFTPNPSDTWRVQFVNNSTEDTITVFTLCLDLGAAH